MPRDLDQKLFQIAIESGQRVAVIDRCENYICCAFESSIELDGEHPLLRLTENQLRELNEKTN